MAISEKKNAKYYVKRIYDMGLIILNRYYGYFILSIITLYFEWVELIVDVSFVSDSFKLLFINSWKKNMIFN